MYEAIIVGGGPAGLGEAGETDSYGLFCAGDNKKSSQFLIVAASEGALAAEAMNQELFHEDTAEILAL